MMTEICVWDYLEMAGEMFGKAWLVISNDVKNAVSVIQVAIVR